MIQTIGVAAVCPGIHLAAAVLVYRGRLDRLVRHDRHARAETTHQADLKDQG